MIEIDDVQFQPLEGIIYRNDYVKVADYIINGKYDKRFVCRTLILDDLFFILVFVMRMKSANHPFIIQACKDIQKGNKTKTLDLWARGHFKSSIITTAEVIQKVLQNPDERICIFSHNRPSAKAFLRRIKLIFETSKLLLSCFPDVLYENPEKESPKWSEDEGIILKRKGYYTESTLEAHGLESQPIGKHYTYRVYDDIETPSVSTTPEVIMDFRSMFDVSHNLSDYDGKFRVVGTPYHHSGLLQHLREEKLIDGHNKYEIRLKPATDDGTPQGKPVFFTQEMVDEKKTSWHFNAQQLLNPTPQGDIKLNPDYLIDINPEFIPGTIYKFMLVDPAGDDKDGTGDSWAIHTVGVEPKMDSIGASNIYILSSIVEPMSETSAVDAIVRKYIEGGIILKVGYERVGNSTPGVMIHVMNALRSKGRNLSEDNGNLEWLKPRGRKKINRIADALSWPLNNSKLHISKLVPLVYRERMRNEMEKFPYWHDDALDALSYIYDMIQNYKFPYQYHQYKPIKYVEMGLV